MDILGFILLAALSGLVVGAIARLIVPGPDPMSIFQTILVGMAGSIIAGLISYYLFDREGVPGILLSVIPAAILVFAIRKARERSGAPAPARGGSPFGGGGTQFGSGNVRVGFMPGCLVFSLVASLVLTVLLNLIVRAF